MRKVLLILIFLIFKDANAQISKKNWLLGGGVSFYSRSMGSEYAKTFNFDMASNLGYFVVDKLAVGLLPELEFTTYKQANEPRQRVSMFSVGPFLRYYLLPAKNKINLFTEASYQLSRQKLTTGAKVHSGTWAFSAGPAFFLTESVSLQFSLSYQVRHTEDDLYPTVRDIRSGLGFLFHF